MHGVRAVLVLLILALAPTVQGHGAPEPREIDVRLLADASDNGDYGGPEGLLDEGAYDALALDVREVRHAALGHAIVFRIIVQGGDASQGEMATTLFLRAGGQDRTYTITGDEAGFTHDFDLVEGPFDVGDGHPKAYDAFLKPATLGIAAGEAINDIRLETGIDGTRADAMPGSWWFMGVEAPSTTAAPDPGRYTTTGPPALLSLVADADILDTSAGEVTATLTLTSALTATDQIVDLTVSAPVGVSAALDSDSLLLAPGQSRDLGLTVSGAGIGEVRILATSDLHGNALVSIPILGNVLSGFDEEVKSGDLATGDSYQYRMSGTGLFDYHCHPHPWMMGTVQVEPADNGTAPAIHTVRIVEPDAADPDTWGFEPRDLTIRLGDIVVWTNEGAMVHDVHGNLGGGHDHGAHGHDGHDHGAHGHGDEENKESPAPVLLPLLAVVSAVFARRR